MMGLAIIIMIVLVIANGIEGQGAGAPPSGNVLDFNCGFKCASQCFARSMMNSLSCMTKCIVGCMSSSPSDALLGCTFDCAANSTTSTVFPDNKPLESIQDFKTLGDNIGNCYAKCDEKMIN